MPITDPADPKGVPIVVGAIVLIKGDNRFTGKKGVVIDNKSDKRPEDGPIAIFFDREVPGYEFYQTMCEDWKGGMPTAENYRQCHRVITFPTEEVEVIAEFDIETIVKREFGDKYWTLNTLNFPLIPNTHSCQMEECLSGLHATERTIINVWGNLYVAYTCSPCHKEWHGRRCDDFKLKNPLPGKPVATEKSVAIAQAA